MHKPEQQGKFYQPEDVRNPYIVVPFFVFLIGGCIYGLEYYVKNPFDNVGMILFLIWGITVCVFLIYIHFTHCVYAEIKEKSVIFKNHFKKKMREIQFDEIIEITSPSRWWANVLIKDTNGNKVVVNASIKPTDEFFNEIITRAVNCKKIDLRDMKKAAPGLIMYEKGLGFKKK